MTNRRLDLKILTVIHIAMFSIQLIFGGIFFGLVQSTKIDLSGEDDMFFLIAPLIALSGIMAATFLYKKFMEQASLKENLEKKMEAHFTAFLIRCVLLEVPTIFSFFCYFLTGNMYYIFVGLCTLLIFLTIKPKAEKIAEDLKLPYQEKDELLNANRHV